MKRVLWATFAIALVGLAAACSALPGFERLPFRPERPTIVLLHGAFFDSSDWEPVARALEAKGRKVVVIDLPGRSRNPFPATRASLDLYRDVVIAAVSREPRPVVLVGHSFGGMTISAAADAVPDKIASLVYVGAYLPKSGESLVSLSQQDKTSLAGPAFRVDPARGVAWIDTDSRAAAFCSDCAPPVAAGVTARMIEEPLAPPGTPVTLGEGFARVPKVYVRTARDRVVSPSLQDQMIAGAGKVHVLGIDSGHLPMVTRPDELAALIDTVR